LHTNNPYDSEGCDRLWKDVEVPNCGTAACIAGWAIALQDKVSPSEAIGALMKASRYLGIDQEIAEDLFYEYHWDDELLDRWVEAESLEERAQIAAERIDQFIASYDKQI